VAAAGGGLDGALRAVIEAFGSRRGAVARTSLLSLRLRYKFLVDPFSPRLLQITDGAASALKPVAFDGRVDELTLERWIVDNPDLVGEPLLVLGNQLAEFAEDKDRLDILALDRFGEIVLIELKVSEDFRVTDLQALAYAGVYAKRSSRDLAQTLQRHLQKQATAAADNASPESPDGGSPSTSPTVTLEDAIAKIEGFLEVSENQPVAVLPRGDPPIDADHKTMPKQLVAETAGKRPRKRDAGRALDGRFQRRVLL